MNKGELIKRTAEEIESLAKIAMCDASLIELVLRGFALEIENISIARQTEVIQQELERLRGAA